MFWDSHCHLYKEYYENLDEIIKRAKENNCDHYITDGTDAKSNIEVLEVIKHYDNVYGCIGIHPENVDDYKESDLDFIEANLNNKKIVAIGEIGLDYHYDVVEKEKQKKLLEKQLEIAKKSHMPVVIHSRESTEDMIEILKKYPSVKGVIHSFSLSIEVARIYIKMGYKLGINGVITFKNCHLKDILKEILPHIILETDSPYLTPHPYRGTKNEPKYILTIAEFICNEMNITMKELSEITNKNLKEVFFS